MLSTSGGIGTRTARSQTALSYPSENIVNLACAATPAVTLDKLVQFLKIICFQRIGLR